MRKTKSLCYLIGALQGDGYFYIYRYRPKDDSKMRTYYRLQFSSKDLEMAERVKETFGESFSRDIKICRKSNGMYEFSAVIKTLMKQLKDLDIHFEDPPKPPQWIDSVNLFGPYLAGLIDTDGSICIKRKKKYPQCKIMITSRYAQNKLKKYIEKYLNCKAYIEHSVRYHKTWRKTTNSFNIVFLMSSKNFKLIKKHILPHIVLQRKSGVIEKYSSIRGW